MTLVVEDGTGKNDANSYVSVSDADAYHALRGNPETWDDATTSEKEAALIEATQYLDLHYGERWRGARMFKTQALDWPRDDVTDDDGFRLPNDEIPQRLANAASEAALQALSNELLPKIEEAAVVRERNRVGQIESETEYAGSKPVLPRYPKIDGLLRHLLTAGGIRVPRG